jgi:molybdopterin molybdotransferase
MVSVAEAEKIILDHLYTPVAEPEALASANGKVLAEEIRADRDLPPFHRATMDGIAISFDRFESGQREFAIGGVQAAGQSQQSLADKAKCFEIMTGAPLPEGTDVVIPYEHLSLNNKIAMVLEPAVKGQNIHRQGSDAKKDDLLLSKGFRISPAEIALLASVGKTKVSVYKNPTAAIISTGDELVDVGETPLPHQIRKSNSYALAASLAETGCSSDVFHLADDKTELEEKIKGLLKNYELIILSGGVSKGKFDFVPQVLESLGVKKLFHQVSQRPGKPMWFGQSEKNTVFALPGNPVSTFMCFHCYVKPWLAKSLGSEIRKQTAVLAADFSFAPKLTYFLQVKIVNESGKLMAHPAAGGGSGDFANLKEVDGFLELPADRSEFNKGEFFPFYGFR